MFDRQEVVDSASDVAGNAANFVRRVGAPIEHAVQKNSLVDAGVLRRHVQIAQRPNGLTFHATNNGRGDGGRGR